MAFLVTRNIAGSLEKLILRGLEIAGIIPPSPVTPGEIIPTGSFVNLTTDVVYALPPNLVNITVYTAVGVIEVSLNGTDWQAMTLDSNLNFKTSAIFIRSITGPSTIIAKSYQS